MRRSTKTALTEAAGVIAGGLLLAALAVLCCVMAFSL